MITFLIWTSVLLACLAGRAAEWRIHRRNSRVLSAAGADERSRWLAFTYYFLHFLVLPGAVAEQLWLKPAVHRDMLLGGIAAVLLGQALRFWAIQSLGTFWTMRCMSLPGLRQGRLGPYRWLKHPDYLSRLIDGVGLCLIFGAKATACIFVLGILALGRRLAGAEAVQAAERHDLAKPFQAQARAS